MSKTYKIAQNIPFISQPFHSNIILSAYSSRLQFCSAGESHRHAKFHYQPINLRQPLLPLNRAPRTVVWRSAEIGRPGSAEIKQVPFLRSARTVGERGPQSGQARLPPIGINRFSADFELPNSMWTGHKIAHISTCIKHSLTCSSPIKTKPRF